MKPEAFYGLELFNDPSMTAILSMIARTSRLVFL
jgi:hypothetical protein